MPYEYLTILKNGKYVIPQKIKDKLHIKEGDVVLIQIQKVYGKENMPKDKAIILL